MKKPVRLALAATLIAVPLVFTGLAGAITNGVPDGNAHPYVGVASSGVPGGIFCSGTLLSATVFLTAGHCTEAFEETIETYGQKPFISVDPTGAPGTYVTGTPYTDPDFFNVPPQGVGVIQSVGGDLGVVVLDRPIELATYGLLSAPGLLDPASARRLSFTLVGYGAQDWISGGGPRFPFFTFVRTRATSSFVNDTNVIGDEFVRLSTNPGGDKGGIGPGDSGSPELVGDGPTVAATLSFGPSPFGSGEVYYTRLDTPRALSFIARFLP
jgi:hypothetical protein